MLNVDLFEYLSPSTSEMSDKNHIFLFHQINDAK